MNKSQLVSAMAECGDLSKKDTQAGLTALLNIIKKRLSEGDQISLAALGTFTLSYHPEKQGRNPQTGEAITIAGQNKVLFKPAKALKDALKEQQ